MVRTRVEKENAPAKARGHAWGRGRPRRKKESSQGLPPPPDGPLPFFQIGGSSEKGVGVRRGTAVRKKIGDGKEDTRG